MTPQHRDHQAKDDTSPFDGCANDGGEKQWCKRRSACCRSRRGPSSPRKGKGDKPLTDKVWSVLHLPVRSSVSANPTTVTKDLTTRNRLTCTCACATTRNRDKTPCGEIPLYRYGAGAPYLDFHINADAAAPAGLHDATIFYLEVVAHHDVLQVGRRFDDEAVLAVQAAAGLIGVRGDAERVAYTAGVQGARRKRLPADNEASASGATCCTL